MTKNNGNLIIRHDQSHQMFVSKVRGGAARLSYSQPKDHVLEFLETYVPKPSREKGIATTMVEHAFGYARRRHCEVIPTCSFVRHFLETNNEYEDLIAGKSN